MDPSASSILALSGRSRNAPHVFHKWLQRAGDKAVGCFLWELEVSRVQKRESRTGSLKCTVHLEPLCACREGAVEFELARRVGISNQEFEIRWSRSTTSEWCRLWGLRDVPQLMKVEVVGSDECRGRQVSYEDFGVLEL